MDREVKKSLEHEEPVVVERTYATEIKACDPEVQRLVRYLGIAPYRVRKLVITLHGGGYVSYTERRHIKPYYPPHECKNYERP